MTIANWLTVIIPAVSKKRASAPITVIKTRITSFVLNIIYIQRFKAMPNDWVVLSLGTALLLYFSQWSEAGLNIAFWPSIVSYLIVIDLEFDCIISYFPPQPTGALAQLFNKNNKKLLKSLSFI